MIAHAKVSEITRQWADATSMLDHRLQRRADIKPTLDQSLVFAGVIKFQRLHRDRLAYKYESFRMLALFD